MIGAPGQREVRGACCSVWTHPLARVLLGDGLHPGGGETTATTVAALGLAPGSLVLDVGCGPGSGLRALSEAGLVGIGIDLAAEAAGAACEVGVAVVGAAENLPIPNECMDGAIAECVLSLVPDKAAAMGELQRVVRPGGRIAFSDVTLHGPLPLPLGPVATWSACVGGALGASGYEALLEDSGFQHVTTLTLDHDLTALLEQVRRRLAVAEMAVRAGRLDLASLHPGLGPEALAAVRGLLSLGLDAVAQGTLGYRLFTASRA